MGAVSQVVRYAVKNFNVKEKTIDRATGTVDADKLATFTEKASRGSKRGYVKNGHQLSTDRFSFHAGLRNYLKTRHEKKEELGAVGQLRKEQIAFIDTVQSVARAGRALNNANVNSSAQFILNGDWGGVDAYRITPELAAHVRCIADALNQAKWDAYAANRQPPALPKVSVA